MRRSIGSRIKKSERRERKEKTGCKRKVEKGRQRVKSRGKEIGVIIYLSRKGLL
ncbi:hypothetical protein RchiOBHm_Chr1g0335281 [Rosa chinensis]|uniref:Uncharacterized protein n=1 Tax=Rosa chinensis TaxID=74649 RepID=A0A2P6SCI9_ROSCH|nr:hypothetical protein RchiOBHm_Chr1g0335281 [Rosa chinensis]